MSRYAEIETFYEHDERGLAALDAAGRKRQMQARRELAAYVDTLWSQAKEAGLNPAILPEWQSVAAMRDLTQALANEAFHAIAVYDDK
ncbi:MAG: hypothetical protein AUG49_25220 [Catenulispora sp. 13_1_20CM_3_70_7]|nr:MAG: hypothetical protein AUG49_25220 [Catenulispora sp. 13_1_20CM_3_70_7]